MNKQNKKSSENSLLIKKDKKNHHSLNEIKECKSDKNPSEIPEKYIEFVRKENLELIKAFMKEVRDENKNFIKLFAKELIDNLADKLADKLAVVLQKSNADLVNNIVEKMKNK